jgi:hypothetical protein
MLELLVVGVSESCIRSIQRAGGDMNCGGASESRSLSKHPGGAAVEPS